MTIATQVSDAPRRAPLRALVSWVLSAWATQPYYALVVSFLFAPYFANAVVGDPVYGQALWGYASAAAGVLIAIGSPLLGALADGRGALKPWIALFSMVFVAALAGLWLAVPSAPATVLAEVLLCFVAATATAAFITVFTNAMMPSLVLSHQLGRFSGTAWAIARLGGLVSLGIMLGLIIANPATGKTPLGLEPLLALDTASRAGDRLVGPFSAAWYALFMIPFFLFVPDVRPAARLTSGERRSATAELWHTIRSLPQHRDMLLFLTAYMLYIDGLSAIFAFSGIYGASVFGWGALELGILGILVMFIGVFGGIIGGVLDDRIGSVAVIIISLAILLAGVIGALSVDKTHIFYATEVAAKTPDSAPFSSAGEKVFLAFALLIGLVTAPLQSASRTLCARLAPRAKITQFFGLFAFSSQATAFAAPFVVAALTTATGNQRLGVSSVVLFLAAGMLLMLPVRQSR